MQRRLKPIVVTGQKFKRNCPTNRGKTNVVKGGFEKNRLIQQSGGSFVVIDTAQGGETGGTLAGRP